jgi:hypothetical protein
MRQSGVLDSSAYVEARIVPAVRSFGQPASDQVLPATTERVLVAMTTLADRMGPDRMASRN